MPKRVFFLSPIQHGLSATSCTDCEHFRNKDVCAHAQTVDKFPTFCAGILQVPKRTENGYFRGVFVIGVQLKRHNFGQCESFRGLVDIPRMCL